MTVSVVILKPDEIGDFILATGAIRLLAKSHGEKNLILVVKSEVLPLARNEFPAARIIDIPWQQRRKGQNQAWANLRHCFSAWRELRGVRAHQCVCLRSARNYLQTLLFAAPRAAGRFASENVLLANGSLRRRMLELWLVHSLGTRLSPYPRPSAEMPAELAAHQAVLSESLGRPVTTGEVMPSLTAGPWRGGDGWLLCPFSSRPSKDYSAENWARALREAMRRTTPKVIRLAGSPGQAARLHSFASTLRETGVGSRVEVSGAVPLEIFPNAVAAADLVLTVDTAGAHFACAIGAPAVIVDSGKNSGTYGPYSPNGRQQWLIADRRNLGRERWQESIPPEMVSSAILRVLNA